MREQVVDERQGRECCQHRDEDSNTSQPRHGSFVDAAMVTGNVEKIESLAQTAHERRNDQRRNGGNKKEREVSVHVG
jgi:hypothetical protein